MTQLNEQSVVKLGLRTSQCRSESVIDNGGWYNMAGEKIGWGDLSIEDLERIPSALATGELFIVLYDEDVAFWDFVTQSSSMGSVAEEQPVDAPGVDYVSDRCRLILMQGHRYYVPEHDEAKSGEEFDLGWHLLVKCEVLSREEAKRLIAESLAAATATV